jgi:hypothetical protein
LQKKRHLNGVKLNKNEKIQPREQRGFDDGLCLSLERYSPCPSRNFSQKCGPILRPLRSTRKICVGSKDPSGHRCRTKFRQGNEQKLQVNCSTRIVGCRNLLDRFAGRKWHTIAMAVLIRLKLLITLNVL